MQPRPLYDIAHICLNSEWLLLPPEGDGKYLVFWWREIVLGHLFIESGQPPLTEVAYEAALLAAIAPAVQYYALEQHASSDPWQEWLTLRDFERWGTWMDVVLARWLPAALPPQVPISVVICTRNRAPQLRRCLQMLNTLACVPTEIVVVDNASTNADTSEVCQEFAGVVYVSEPRAGLDIARNTGIATAQCPIIAFIDDDVVVHAWLVYRIWETFQDPAIAAMTGLVMALELQTEAQLIFEQHWSFNRGYCDKSYGPEYMRAAANHAPRVWKIGAGANMAFRKVAFEAAGNFNELLDVGAAGCSGDSEMWYRILAHGHTIAYNPRAIIYHEHRKELSGLKSQLFYYMRGHVAAALIQHEQYPQAGYFWYLYRELPKYYLFLIRVGFPFFRFRSRTLWAELKGLASGIAFYYRNQSTKPQR
jgi:glycosyltransferase involved in cell wall biosynthesis